MYENVCFLISHLTPDVLRLFKNTPRDFPGSPVADTPRSVQGAWAQSLVRELDPTCTTKKITRAALRPSTAKEIHKILKIIKIGLIGEGGWKCLIFVLI